VSIAKQISFQIDSRLDSVSLVGVGLFALCRDQGIDEVTSYQIQTAATEAINNAIIHAYDSQPSHLVNITWIMERGLIRIEITDRGKSMKQLPPDIEPAPDAANGRGWWIMRRWMNKVDYQSLEGLNVVTISKYM